MTCLIVMRVIEQLAGQGEMPQIFLGPNGPILRFQREGAAEKELQDHGEGNDHHQYQWGPAVPGAEVPDQIHYRADERDDDQGKQNEVEQGNVLCVILVILLCHLVRPPLACPGDYSRSAGRNVCRGRV